MEREYIAISFNDDTSKITPVIRMSGSDGLKKVIHGVGGIRNIGIFHVDFMNQTTENIGNIHWPDPSLTSDVVIQYEPEEHSGTVRLMEINQVWSYSVNSEPGEFRPDYTDRADIRESQDVISDNVKKSVVDKDKVRQMEAEKKLKILWPDELADELKKEVFGQDEAIRSISEVVAANLRRKRSEVEVIMLFGPTGVGKTETGKALPAALKKLTGQEYGFQQIAMNQYTESHSLHQWFGAPHLMWAIKILPCLNHADQIRIRCFFWMKWRRVQIVSGQD